ncbi:MAG: ATP phosphoribosyltransferase [Cellvibrionales bacterium TMED79]|jgi:ATP phosphoribosyltransferase|uniref:ATP phosphoribosyltransferase n=1 Tax=Candidatus Paraluminiphilus aquimaris TaxID=2518994 RepID=A0ABY6Q980_9GAMM|nr:ATP phosphoribosyltransferase [Candidatus Paraluminiphilus aquimaris]MAJ53039.1 ATP phosphoribosyltransferase [Halieaceae bacterium]OUV03860.1 MAG: ATP phosphoribosyltransferase [Cellvibrionales bacterium TMED79]UZP75443.1 ATP phosphoribosyltransferase [Candidatus Paraluminiphilus aquimaris]
MPSEADTLTIALTKGRILKETLPLFEGAGIVPLDDIATSRKLIFPTTHESVKFVLLRGSDVPTYVRHGAADMGVVGKDILMEFGDEGLYEILDLEIARCRLMTAGIDGAQQKTAAKIRVATKFVNVAREHYSLRGLQPNIIKLYGAMELAPIMRLADEIVDIVDTGNTLKANGMVPREHIADISSRLIVNKASMRTRNPIISTLLESISDAVALRRTEK